MQSEYLETVATVKEVLFVKTPVGFMTRDEYLRSRIVELVVHTNDLQRAYQVSDSIAFCSHLGLKNFGRRSGTACESSPPFHPSGWPNRIDRFYCCKTPKKTIVQMDRQRIRSSGDVRPVSRHSLEGSPHGNCRVGGH